MISDIVKNKKSDILKDSAAFIAGSAVYAVSVNVFTAPNGIAPGGITGVATIFNYLFGIPIGLFIFILNIPIFIIGTKKLGFKFLSKTIISTLLLSAAVDGFSAFLPAYRGDKLLACIYGGVLSGTGLALVLLRGSTTGGTDIIAKLFHIKFPYISMGRIILLLDAVVIAFAAIAWHNIENALYAMIAIFTSTLIIDNILGGADKGKVVLINSRFHGEISREIMSRMGRGVTILQGSGGYTGSERRVIMCAIRRQETARINKIIKLIDKEAFVVTFEAGEILGEGFKRIENYFPIAE